jgi:hypothetical protein
VNFLLGKGTKRLTTFLPNTPILYVFEDMYRGDEGPFRNFPPDKRPSLAVVHDPINLDFDSPVPDEEESGRVVYELENHGGRVDLYAINPTTHELILVGTENKTKKYHVRKDRIFEMMEGLM